MNKWSKQIIGFVIGFIIGVLGVVFGMRLAFTNDPLNDEGPSVEYFENIISVKDPEGYKNAVSRHYNENDLERHYYFDEKCLNISLRKVADMYNEQISDMITKEAQNNTLEVNNREVTDINGLQYVINIDGYTTDTEYVPNCEISAMCLIDDKWLLDVIYTNGNEGKYKSFSKGEIDQFIDFLGTIYEADDLSDPELGYEEDNEDDEEMTGEDIDSLIKTEIEGKYYGEDDDIDTSIKEYVLDNEKMVTICSTRAAQKDIEEFKDEYAHLQNNKLAENGREAMELNGIQFTVQEGGTAFAGEEKYYLPNTNISASCIVKDNIIDISMEQNTDKSLTQEEIDAFVIFLNGITTKE